MGEKERTADPMSMSRQKQALEPGHVLALHTARKYPRGVEIIHMPSGDPLPLRKGKLITYVFQSLEKKGWQKTQSPFQNWPAWGPQNGFDIWLVADGDLIPHPRDTNTPIPRGWRIEHGRIDADLRVGLRNPRAPGGWSFTTFDKEPHDRFEHIIRNT